MSIFPSGSVRDARFIPEIWTSAIWEEMRSRLVVSSDLVCNRDYEGEIRNAGDVVYIPTVLDPEIEDYDPQTGFSGDPQDVTSGKRSFEIEKARAWRIKVDDIARVQSLIGGKYLDEGTQRAARKLAEAADTYVAGKITAAVTDSERKITVDLSAAPDVLYGQWVDANTALDKTETPLEGSWAIISPEMKGRLLRDDRFIDASKFGNSEAIRNGVIGSFLGFTVLVTNALPDDVHLIAGHRIATTFADQLVKTEAYRPEKFFADVVRGLHVYGAKVMRPEHLVVGSVASGG